MPGSWAIIPPILSGLLALQTTWRTEERWKWHSELPDTPTAVPQSFTIAADRRFCSRIWSGSGTDHNHPTGLTFARRAPLPLGHDNRCPYQLRSLTFPNWNETRSSHSAKPIFA